MSGSLYAEFGFWVFFDIPEYARNSTYRVDLGSGRVGMGWTPSGRVFLKHPCLGKAIFLRPASRPKINVCIKYSRWLFPSMDGLERLSRKASTPRRPYPTINQPYMSQSGQFPRYRKIPKIRIPHKVILTWIPLKGADGPVIFCALSLLLCSSYLLSIALLNRQRNN